MYVEILAASTLITGAYLLGSIPFGLVLSKIFFAADLRSIGSGNIGATNARRVGGWPLGLATLILDMAKGAIPAAMGLLLFGRSGYMAQTAVCVAALAAFLGHLYPVYLRCKTGGKGVATAGGCFLVLSPVAVFSSLAVFIGVTALFKRVSAGSLAAAATLPIAVYFAEKSAVFVLGALVFFILILLRHRENIIRLANNTEPRI